MMGAVVGLGLFCSLFLTANLLITPLLVLPLHPPPHSLNRHQHG